MLRLFVLLCCFCAVNLQAETKVLAFSASTRCESTNKKLVKEAARFAQDMGATVKLIDLKDYPMPFYDGDLEEAQGLPVAAQRLKELVKDANLVMIASPEYNGSYPALLKNVLDWLSRGEESSTFKDKTFLIMSTSPGPSGGGRGLVLVRSLLETLGGKVLPSQIALPQGYQAFDEAGHLKDEQWAKRLRQSVQSAL